jgi:hypothetical protein
VLHRRRGVLHLLRIRAEGYVMGIRHLVSSLILFVPLIFLGTLLRSGALSDAPVPGETVQTAVGHHA